MTWQRLFFELDELRLLAEVGGVEDDLASGVEAAHVSEADVVVSVVCYHHVAIATIEVSLQQQEIIIFMKTHFVVVNLDTDWWSNNFETSLQIFTFSSVWSQCAWQVL